MLTLLPSRTFPNATQIRLLPFSHSRVPTIHQYKAIYIMKAPLLLLALASSALASYCPPQWIGKAPFCNTLGGCPAGCTVLDRSGSGCWFGSKKQLCDCCDMQPPCPGGLTSCLGVSQTCCSNGKHLGWCFGIWQCPEGPDFTNITSPAERDIISPEDNFASPGGQLPLSG